METERIEHGLVLQTTSDESIYDTSHSLADEGDIDSQGMDAAKPSHKGSLSSLATQQTRTPRTQRKSINTNKPPAPNTTTFGLTFRSSGTKESIDRSTCSTVVGSTHGDTTHSRRVRQGSDLSALSHCSEVDETNPASPAATEPLHDNTTECKANGEDEPSPTDFHKARFRRRAMQGKCTALPPNRFQDLTSKTCPTHPASKLGESHSHSDDALSKAPEDKEEGDSDSSDNDDKDIPLSLPEGVNNDQDDSNSSSSNDIAFDCDSSSSDGGSIEILRSTLRITDEGNQDIGVRRSTNSNKEPMFSLAFKSSIIKKINAVRLICGKIINHPYVQHAIIFLIVVNALLMGIATFDFVDNNPSVQAVFGKVDLTFLIIFTVESGLQLIFHGINLFRDSWLTFDFLIVICSWAFGGMQVFRTLRTLRLVGRVESLKRLCEALVEAVPRLAGILFLFILIMYIYAVMVTELFGDLYKEGVTSDDYFSRLDITLFTLFQMITLDWANIVREVMEVYPLSWTVFITYLSFTSFILFSLIIGVVCDAVSATEHDSNLIEGLQQREKAQERILRLQHQVDYLKKQQKSVLASVQTVLEEIVEQERFYEDPLRTSNRSLRGSNRLRTSIKIPDPLKEVKERKDGDSVNGGDGETLEYNV